MRRLLLGPYTPRAARQATSVALFFQWFIVLSGATVRLTGSGLGCPNWPTCTTTRPVPELSMHPMIEFINRMLATPTLLAALIATWVCWRLLDGRRGDLRLLTTLTVIGILGQAVVGATAVIMELPPEIVSAHFLLSLLCMATATAAWHGAGRRAPLCVAGRRGGMRAVAGVVMLLSLLSVIVAGVLTTASGPHSGGGGTGHDVDRFGIFDLAVTLHARGAYVFLVLVLLLSWARARRGIALIDLGVLLALVVVQVTLGEVQYRSGLPWGVVLAHVVNAAAMWIVAVRIAVDAACVPDGPASTTDDESGRANRYDPATSRAPLAAASDH